MWPNWLLGAFMLWSVAKTRSKDLIRVDKKALKNWLNFLVNISMIRILLATIFHHKFAEMTKDVVSIPWPLTLTVFWEDACHGLPLVLIQRFLGTSKWTWPIHAILTLLVMFEFGLGHVYQGVPAAIMLSFYIPVSMHLGKKYGFGTVMVGHTLYDLFTVLTLKILTGA